MTFPALSMTPQRPPSLIGRSLSESAVAWLWDATGKRANPTITKTQTTEAFIFFPFQSHYREDRNLTGPGAESTIFALSVTFVRAADPQQVLDALAVYYAAVGRPGPETVAAEAEHQLVTWEDGYEPEPSMPLNLLISPLEGGWVAIAFRGATTFDLPFTAWLALKLQS